MQVPPFRRQRQRARCSSEQAKAEPCLQPLNAFADRRRGNTERPRRPRVAALRSDPGECDESGQAIDADMFLHGTYDMTFTGIVKLVARQYSTTHVTATSAVAAINQEYLYDPLE